MAITGGESKFWQELRHGFRSMGFVSRVESHDTAIGIPDVHIILRGGLLRWIELKYSDTASIRVRPSQRMWIRNAQRNGYRPVVLTKWVRPDSTLILFNRSVVPLDEEQCSDWMDTADAIWDDQIEWSEFEELIREEK